MNKVDYQNLQLGSIFKLGYLEFVVTKFEGNNTDKCEHCCFGKPNFETFTSCGDIQDFIPNCNRFEREDGNSVVFKEIKE